MARRRHHAVLTASALLPLAAASALAGPNGANVVGGAATVQGQGTANVVVNQSTQNAIINWQTFNIGSGETTKILMPNSSSAQLDRVTGRQGPSQILGTLSSNGKVFLVNPDGILFGMGASINVGSLVATTNDIANKDFMAGRYNFSIPGNPNASIVNLGTITAQTGGFAALVAPGVRNAGVITAKLGTIALASGNAFTLDMYGDNLITLGLTDSISKQVVDVSTGKPLSSLVSNEGKLKANGGTVTLTASAARAIVDSVINNSGVIEANSIGSRNGMIVLGAATADRKPAGTPAQTVTLSGKLSAKGRRKGTSGGTVIVTGEKIAVSGAQIDASGNAGGGKVLIGGDWGGGHPNTGLASGNASARLEPYGVPNANTVSIDAATMIDASATEAGNGGKVVVWANQATTFVGTILAKGGAQAGNGGYVETSGGTLTFNGAVNTSAPNGRTGTWLIDPTNLTIDATGAATISGGLSENDILVYTNSGGASGQGTKSSGAGDIIVASAISWSSGHTLTLDAYHDIIINSAISGTSGGLTLNAANAISASAPVTVGTFTLQNGAWSQLGSLPAFSANNFVISGGSFLRASGGDGSAGSPYQIVDVYGLQGIGTSSTLLAGNYVLANSIDASGTANWNEGAGFVPIGNARTQFAGTFDGNANTISNITINQPGSSEVGLFGSVGLGGAVKNVSLLGGTVTGDSNVGALVGSNFGSVSGSSASAAVTGNAEVGGLIGLNTGSVSQSHASGTVTGKSSDDVGGLVGWNPGGTITQSYATGNVTGPLDVGGLVGDNSDGTVTQSYATGTVTGTNTGFDFGVGGLVGYMYGGSVSQSYATGAVSAPDYVGGLIGWTSSATITQSYATGMVNGTGNVGGLIGYNNSSVTQTYATGSVTGATPSTTGSLIGVNDESGSVVSSYWDINTSPANGYGTNSGTFGGQGLTTAQFQAGLPSGFDATAWSSNISYNGGLPYLLWAVPAGSQVIAGYVFNDVGITSAGGGISVAGLVNGTSVGSVTTGANGSYNIVVLPGTISASGSQVLTYTTGSNAGAAYVQNATGSVENLNIYIGYLNETSGAANLSTVSAGLATAIGANASVQSLVNSLSNRAINATGTSFAIDQSLSTGTLLLSGAGALTQSAPITATNLALSGSGGSFTLTNSANQIGTLAANTGSVNLTDSTNLGIGSVAGTGLSGITATTLMLTDTGAVTQTAPITATNLALSGSGSSFTLANSGNQIGTLAANAGSVSLTDAANLNIGTVAGTNGVTATTLSLADGGAVTQSAPLIVTNLALLGGGTFTLDNAANQVGVFAANAGSVNLAAAANLNIGTVGSANGVTAATLTLTDNGAVVQSAPLTVTNLALLGGGSFTLTNAANQIGTLAANTGSVNLTDSTNLGIGTVGGTSGITATTLMLTDTGAVTQAAPITATNLALSGSGGSFTLTNAANQIGTLAANTGNVSIAAGTSLSIGTVGSTGGITASEALTLDVGGSIAATGAVDAGTFTLVKGDWSQVTGSLPAFSAQNFVLSGGSFLRAAGGDGSAASPYQIMDVYGLQGIGSSSTLLAANFVLANNIDASGTANWNGGAGFVPIGANNATSFSGTLNGNGDAISGLTINASSLNAVGLFGVVGATGTVENVGLTGGSVSGGSITGELIGLNSGAVSNSYATGVVNGSASTATIGGLIGSNEGTITGSYATGAVNGGNLAIAGGLAGLNLGAITQSYATGNVTTGTNGFAGGLVGINLDTSGSGGAVIVASIANSHATGNVSAGDGAANSTASAAGGLVGDNFGTVAQSYATGAVTVGANGTAGGLVGQNGLGITGGLGTASISGSYATGQVSSSGLNVQLGGLVGQNAPGAQITNSQATGNVTSTASLSSSNNNSDCTLTNTCQFVNVGGFVGANYGTISGTTWTSAPTNCAASYACASGAVAVGALGSGGGFAGYNEGIIKYAFATGNVTGAAGLPGTVAGDVFANNTQIAGFVADNRGQISNAFAIGAVGSAGTMWLSAGGFAGSNAGSIDAAFARGAVMAGDNSTAGGFVASNSAKSSTQTCPGCFTGDGLNNSATISNSQASGNVTAGAFSVAGGFAASGGSSKGTLAGSFSGLTASGAVNAGHDSMVGGLVGALLTNATLSNSSAQNTLVASSGPNSIVGGVVGLNEGTISGTTSTAPVSGTSDSYIGGITGINLGSVTGSSTDPAISGSGGNNFIGGIAGLNAGSINGSTALIDLSGGSPNYAGGVAGVNGSYSNTNASIPNSSFPNGTITNSSATGSGFNSQIGTSSPTWMPGLPSWLAGCTDAACTSLTGGSLQTSSGGSGSGSGSNNNNNNDNNNSSIPANTISVSQQVTLFTQPVNFTGAATPPPVINTASLTTGGANAAGEGANGNTGSLGGSGNTGSLATGKQGGNGAPPGVRLIDMPIMPLPPGSGMPPVGETRFLTNEVVLQFGPEVTPEQVTAVARRFHLTIVAQHTIAALHRTVYTFRINDGESVAEVIRQIESAGLKVAVQPNYTYQFTQDGRGSAADPADLGDPAQYIVQKLQLGAVHRISRGNDVVVALIDSRVDLKQPDFAGRIVDYYDAGCGPNAPPDAHGTGMAGAIAAHVGLLGVAPNAKIIAICAFGGTGSPEATSTKIIRGLDYAIAHGVKIVNMSFAGPHDPALAQELQIAREKGILIIAAAGNAGPKSPPLYPGADPNVMAVTATDEHDRLFNGANQGSYVAVAAPGVNILVPAPNGDVQFTTGTSVASANVSGVAALLLAERPTRTPEEIRAILVDTAKHLGPKGVNPLFGAGLVDPLKALRFVPATLGRRPTASAAPLQLH